MLVYTAHCAMANRLGLPHVLHTLIHRLLVHQCKPKPSMQRGCFHRVFTFDLAKENVQLFFGKVKQTATRRATFTVPRFVPCSSVFPA